MEAEQTIESQIKSTPSNDELQAFVGAGNYLSKWQKMRLDKFALAGFNFWAFLFVHSYYFYRKMYTWGFIFIAVSLLLPLGAVFLFGYIGAKFHLFSSIEQLKQQAIILSLAISLLIMLTSGMLANRIYYSYATFSIRTISKLKLSCENNMLAIKGKGGVNMAGFFMGLAITIVSRTFLN
jgi:type III secretory pathway component EscS